ncbi:MAG: NYN domain-containing protein [Acidobacteria bacterium]|uniref:NYN domain-containing protein n=1 Tax=Candidatus Polarisedimenticola svalbardensis TaxID=2886004 RepID=A0A8J6Y6A3_9BACT|nr:NYN domain-containing protein [Candidatus Polarisedimenticola svalbardensis]
MPIMVDGDNLLGAWRGRSRSDRDKRHLAGQIFRFAVANRRRVVVVFDGVPDTPPPSADVLFSGHGRKADDLILSLLGAESDPRGWIIVTNDRPLGDRCRHLGARVERCDVFRKRLTTTGDGEKPVGRVDVDDWLEWFGEDT